MKNPVKELSKIKSGIIAEIEGGILEPVAADRLLHLSREIRNVAIHVFANEIHTAMPSKIASITWTGWYGEDENGAPGQYVDNVEIVFMVNGMAYGLPVHHDFYDYDSAPLTLISALAEMPVSNIQDAEKALMHLNEKDTSPISIDPSTVEDFCTLVFRESGSEEWSFSL